MAEHRIAIDRGDYYELTALHERIQREQTESAMRLSRWVARSNDILTRLGTAHGFDPKTPIRTEDAGCVLIVTDPLPGD